MNKYKNALDELASQTEKEVVYQDEINGYVDVLENLIDCQLTVEEIKTLIGIIEIFFKDLLIDPIKYLNVIKKIENKDLDLLNESIIDKLIKQMELLEDE